MDIDGNIARIKTGEKIIVNNETLGISADGLAYIISDATKKTSTVYGYRGNIDYSVTNNLTSTLPVTAGEVEIAPKVKVDRNIYKVNTIGDYAFYKANKLVSIKGDTITTVKKWCLRECSKLKKISLAQLEKITSESQWTLGVLGDNSGVDLYLPNLQSSAAGNVLQQSKFTNIYLHNLKTVQGNAFLMKNTKLKAIVLPKLTKMYVNMFYDCSSLEALVLATPECQLPNAVSCLGGTKIAKGTGYVYVPKEYVNSYKAATNWTTYANQIVGYEEVVKFEGETFEPIYTDSNIVKWDLISINEANGNIDSETGKIEITNKGVFSHGDVLLRGLDANDKPVYTYLIHVY